MSPEEQGAEDGEPPEDKVPSREESIEALMAQTGLSKGEASRIVDQIIERREDETK